VAALAIALVISSTTVYVYELSRETSGTDTSQISNSLLLALKQGTINAMMSALANVSNGGDKTVLTNNLNALSRVFEGLNSGIYRLGFTLRNDTHYDSGLWLSWNTSGMGVSSAYANFTLTAQSEEAETTMSYVMNATTAILVDGSYSVQMNGEKLVSLTCRLSNEGETALAKNLTVYHEEAGSWTRANVSSNLSIVDYGNGTYIVSFIVHDLSSTVNVSVHAVDSRDVFVRANTICYGS
jgi:hypothetical protein